MHWLFTPRNNRYTTSTSLADALIHENTLERGLLFVEHINRVPLTDTHYYSGEYYYLTPAPGEQRLRRTYRTIKESALREQEPQDLALTAAARGHRTDIKPSREEPYAPATHIPRTPGKN